MVHDLEPKRGNKRNDHGSGISEGHIRGSIMVVEQLVFFRCFVMVIAMPGKLVEHKPAHDMVAIPGMDLANTLIPS